MDVWRTYEVFLAGSMKWRLDVERYIAFGKQNGDIVPSMALSSVTPVGRGKDDVKRPTMQCKKQLGNPFTACSLGPPLDIADGVA